VSEAGMESVGKGKEGEGGAAGGKEAVGGGKRK